MARSARVPLTKREMAGLAVLGVLLLAVVGWPWPQVTEETYNRIEYGMNPRQVLFVVGGCAGDYRNGPTRLAPDANGLAQAWSSDFRDGQMQWEGDSGIIIVYFHKRRAVAKYFTRYTGTHLTPFERLQWKFDSWWGSWHQIRE
jgi:hypothetical protein